MEAEKKEAPIFSDEDIKLLTEMKEAKRKEALKAEMKEMFKEDFETLQKEIAKVEVKEKPMLNKEEKKMEMSQEMKEFKEIFSKEIAIEEKFLRAGRLAEKEGLVYIDGVDSLGYKKSKEFVAKEGNVPKSQFKQFGTNGSKLEFKGLGITTNQNTDTDYLLSAAELRDVFDPVIYDVLNQSTTTWGLLRKDDFSGKGNNQVQFVLRTAANATAGFYTGNSVATANGGRLKMQTKFKKAQAGIAVDGDMIAAARGSSIGDVFGLEVKYATEDLLHIINVALFAEVGLETAAAIIGFEYIADSAGNTSMYNMTRVGNKALATYNGLAPDAAGDTYINGASALIDLNNLALCIEQAVKEGANIDNLVFITHPTQARLYKGIYRGLQKLVPTSTKFGFVGRAEFDGVPIFEDKDCTSDNWFLVDLDTHRVAVWVPPTLEMLGKRSDSEEGFIKTYFAIYNTAPRRLCMVYDNATS